MPNDDWSNAVERRIASLETRIAVDAVYRTNVENRLGAIEDALKWLVRLVLGALVMAVVAYALRGGFNIS